MAKFNSSAKGKTKTQNKAGGVGYKQKPEHELVGILNTSFVENSFYESSGERLQRLRDVMDKCDNKFLAKAAIYARDQFNMRSITHVVAGELASELSGTELGKKFYEKVVIRPDDMSEIISYLAQDGANLNKRNRVKLPNALKKGFANSIQKFDSYQLAKYKMERRDVSLVDIVNMVHPRPSKKNGTVVVNTQTYLNKLSDKQKEKKGINESNLGDTVEISSLEALTLGLLKSENTWEAKQSAAGKNAETKEEAEQAKKEGWEEQVNKGNLGFMALLKNLRNILQTAPHLSDKVAEQLTDNEKVKNSRVLPFRIMTAAKELEKLPQSSDVEKVIDALHESIEIAVENIPNLDGNTVVFVDVSGSMEHSRLSRDSVMNRDEVACMFGAALNKKMGAKVIAFGSEGQSISLRKSDSVFTNAKKINDDYKGSRGTSFEYAMEEMNRLGENFDRMIWITDDQGWFGSDGDNAMSILNEYENKTGKNVNVYSMQLDSYGTTKFAQNKVLTIPGFSEKIFDLISLMETDPDEIVKQIEAIKL